MKAIDITSVKNALDLPLYHGTMGIEGNSIQLQSNKGVGWNSLTLGNAFYTSTDLNASKLFSHLILQKTILMEETRMGNMGFAKIYQIKLSNDINILDAKQPLDADAVRGVLLYAGVPKRYLNFVHDDQLTEFYKSADLLCYGHNWEGNRNEYLTKALGCDALMVRERAWESWDYYPNGIGIEWDSVLTNSQWPPLSVAIYDTTKIHSFVLVQNGIDLDRASFKGEGHELLAR